VTLDLEDKLDQVYRVSLLSFIAVFPRHDRWRETLNDKPMGP